MPAANLILSVLGVVVVVVAVRGLGGAWPMQVASFVALALWVVPVVWGAVNLLSSLSGNDPDDSVRSLLGYLLVVAPLTGLGLAFVALVKCGPAAVPRLFHAIGLLVLLLVLVVGLADGGDTSTAGKVWAVVLLLLWGLAWLVPYLLLRGRVDPAAYASAPNTYKLPYPKGERGWVIQGNNSAFNHNHGNFTQGFAWDFRRPCGTPVLAALGGTVVTVVDSNDGIGGANNEIEVRHADGSVASYLHIKKGSAQVLVGAAVAQGTRLAEVGSVGHSLTGHIHFHVRNGPDTVPVRFADVTRHDSIPRGFRFYTSANP